jgi:type I pantothenate kinase
MYMLMSPRRSIEFSPYRFHTRKEWAKLRADTPMTLTEQDLDDLAGVIERVSYDEVEHIYLPLSRLINFYVRAAQSLFGDTSRFLGGDNIKTPFIIGMAGSVAVGKSTAARVLRALLARWNDHMHVDLVPTDGFLLPNRVLEKRNLMERKGFPESYDIERLLQFLADVKSGRSKVPAPVYSHASYDIVPDGGLVIDRPDILIVEGLNVLQPAKLPMDGEAIPFVSDFFDFSIFIDADPAVIERWYVTRFMRLRETAFRDPAAYFHRYASLSESKAQEVALRIWREINLKNLVENILPTRQRADLILVKGKDHRVDVVALRKL